MVESFSDGDFNMDRDMEVLEIYQRDLNKRDKIRLLEDMVLDLVNELEAEDQNMRTKTHNRASQGLQLAKNLLRGLRQ